MTEHQIDKEKKISLESGHPVEWAREENYVFPLEEFRTKLKSWLDENEIIQPVIFKNQLNMFFNEEMPDLSVSRSSSRHSVTYIKKCWLKKNQYGEYNGKSF